MWGLALARFIGDGAFYFFAFWIPNYLSDVRGFGLGQIAIGAAIPFIFADVGALFGGWAGQRLIRNGWSVDRSRKTMIWAGALMVPLALPAVYLDSPVLAVLFMGLGIFAIQLKSASMFPLPADLIPAHAVATVWGASGAAGSLAAALSQPLIGWTIDHYSYEPVFIAVSSTARKSSPSNSGAIFTSSGLRVVPITCCTACRILRRSSAFCSARKPGVFGELTFTVRKSA